MIDKKDKRYKFLKRSESTEGQVVPLNEQQAAERTQNLTLLLKYRAM